MIRSETDGAANSMDPAAIRSVFIGLMLAILLGALDQTIVAVSLPMMADQLQGVGLLAWVVSGYLVAFTVATPIYGKLSDLYGRRGLLSFAIGLFLLASILCALAQTMPQLVAARVLQGLGGGGLISLAQAIIADMLPPRERGRYQGYISGMFVISSVSGPVIGGLLTEYLSWRWIFWINLPIGVAAFLISRRALRHLPVPRVPQRIDYLGVALLVAGLTAILLAISRVGQGVHWLAPDNLVLFGVGVLLLFLFARQEKKQPEPFIPVHLLRIPTVGLCSAILFLVMFQSISLVTLFPLRFQALTGAGASAAALFLIPLPLGIPFGSYVVGKLMTYSGRHKPWQLAGASLLPPALCALAFVPPTERITTALLMFVVGFGVGLQAPSSLVAIQNSVPQRNMGVATATTAFFRSLGGAVGIAVLSTVLLAALHAYAPAFVGNFSGGETLRDLLRDAAAHTNDLAHQHLRTAAQAAFRDMFLVSVGVSLVSFTLVCLLPDRELRGHERKPMPATPPE